MKESKIIETEKKPRDISSEFINMDMFEFDTFLRTLKNEPSISINIPFKDYNNSLRLKAFIEKIVVLSDGAKQKRIATIRGTVENKAEIPNITASGVKFELI